MHSEPESGCPGSFGTLDFVSLLSTAEQPDVCTSGAFNRMGFPVDTGDVYRIARSLFDYSMAYPAIHLLIPYLSISN